MKWYFSVPSWKVYGLTEASIPVRALLQGTESDPDGSNNNLKTYTHYYEWTDFVVATPPQERFTVPNYCFPPCVTDCNNNGVCIDGACKCVSGWSGDQCQNKDMNRLALELGLGLGFAALACIVVGVLCCVCRRRELNKYRRNFDGAGGDNSTSSASEAHQL